MSQANIRNPLAFVRVITATLIEKRHQAYQDLLQVGLLKLWQIGEGYPVCYYWKACRGEMIRYLAKERRCKYVRRDGYFRPAVDPTAIVEYRDFYQAALYHLLDHSSSPEQGAKDATVFQLLWEKSTYAEIAQRCPWLKDADSVEHAAARIVTVLREWADADQFVPIELRRRSPQQQRTYVHKDYQRQYYQQHRQERIDAAIRNKRARRELALSRMNELHPLLLEAGYKRHAVSSSGSSFYYVHPDGFQVRVSSHNTTKDIFSVRADKLTPQAMLGVIEDARKERLQC